MNQYLYSFMKKMSFSEKIPASRKSQSLFKLLAKVSKLLHLNELEVVVWSLWLDALRWTMRDFSLEIVIFIAAMQTKEYLNDDETMKVYTDEFNDKYKNVMEAYGIWTDSVEHAMNIDITDINKRYSEFREVLLVLSSSLPPRRCLPFLKL